MLSPLFSLGQTALGLYALFLTVLLVMYLRDEDRSPSGTAILLAAAMALGGIFLYIFSELWV